ncbi:hypothetical protein BC829DRAFT_45479 [Chytridium lagenaria]|nr:hypothetical protein BC829DRAFT_45479 [Chytridium lagenaria]
MMICTTNQRAVTIPRLHSIHLHSRPQQRLHHSKLHLRGLDRLSSLNPSFKTSPHRHRHGPHPSHRLRGPVHQDDGKSDTNDRCVQAVLKRIHDSKENVLTTNESFIAVAPPCPQFIDTISPPQSWDAVGSLESPYSSREVIAETPTPRPRPHPVPTLPPEVPEKRSTKHGQP